MKPEIVVGTSGFSFGDWVGPVYPPGTPRTKMLELYAEKFTAVEATSPPAHAHGRDEGREGKHR